MVVVRLVNHKHGRSGYVRNPNLVLMSLQRRASPSPRDRVLGG